MSDQTSPEQPRDTRSWPRRHPIITSIGVLVVAGIIGASIGSSSSPTISLSPAAQPTTSAPAPADTTAPAETEPATPAEPTPAETTPPANPAPKHTVTYVVTGSTADVTYGPIGSSNAGTSPMHKRVSLDSTDAIGYSLTAQLQGGGAVACKIVIDGQTVASASASGGYNIAMCETVKDPLTGEYKDALKS